MKMKLKRSLFGIDSVRSMMRDSYSPVSMGNDTCATRLSSKSRRYYCMSRKDCNFNERTIPYVMAIKSQRQKLTNGAMIKNRRSESSQCFEQDTANANTRAYSVGYSLSASPLLALRFGSLLGQSLPDAAGSRRWGPCRTCVRGDEPVFTTAATRMSPRKATA